MGAIGVKEKCANGSCGWCKHCIPDMGKPFVLTGLSNGAMAKCRAFNLRNWDQGGGLQMHSGCFTSPSWRKFSYISAMLIEELPCKYQVSLPPAPKWMDFSSGSGTLFTVWMWIFFWSNFFWPLGHKWNRCVCHRPQLGKAMSKHNEVIVKHQYSSRVLAIAGRNTEESSVNWVPGDRQKSLKEKKKKLCICLIVFAWWELHLITDAWTSCLKQLLSTAKWVCTCLVLGWSWSAKEIRFL